MLHAGGMPVVSRPNLIDIPPSRLYIAKALEPKRKERTMKGKTPSR
jgi:hypothetical protein